MDGTLILSDMSRISIRRVLFRKPWLIPSVIFKEMTGKRAGWKRDLGRILVFNPSELEYHEGFLEWLTGEHSRGRVIILATASDRIVAEQVAAHVGMFSDVMASDNDYNLRDRKKAEALVARYGEGGLDTLGTVIMTSLFGKKLLKLLWLIQILVYWTGLETLLISYSSKT